MVEVNGPKVYAYLFGNHSLPITETMVSYWIVMVFIAVLCLFLTSKMEKIPKAKQAIAEKFVMMIDGLIDQNMGKDCRQYSPFVATLMLSSVFGSLSTMFTFRSVTGDLNTTLGWALIVFVLIIYNKIKTNGFIGFLKSFGQPMAVMAPLNVLSELAVPVSMSFRHFGNIAGGMVISTLIVSSLGALSTAIHLPIPLFEIGIPGILSLYFDIFDSCVQAFIFSMLTMAYVGGAREE